MALGIPQLPGKDPAAAAARALRRDIRDKAAARRYEQHCRERGLSALEANLLAPANVKHGQSLRSSEERHRQREVLKAKKEKMEQQFGDQGRTT